MKAYVLCGGEGTRLRPHTYKVPKPMLMLGDAPILSYVLAHLKKNGIEEIILSVGYLKEQIMEYFGEGRSMGLRISYLEEEKPQNTAGALIPLKGKEKESFVVTMGDHITDINLREMGKSHRKSGALATIALASYKLKVPYGVVETDKQGLVKGFSEKPEMSYSINAGAYILEPGIFDFIKPGDDFAKNVFPRLLEKGEKINTYSSPARWFDIGSLNEYEEMKEKFEKGEFARELGL